ncbi:RNA polymerase sigma-70 factor [Lentzea sp. JNUCC 0626]|uniref:RNA polymerase sigma-70 factor n=1 Tax=Lentzea sp. JNUCC 0626 TaxID=3367513 RepID=UPI0037482506
MSTEFDRARLFGIAYRVLGSAADAEDVVQDTWLRLHRTDPASITNPGAFLATTATRLAINAATSARARREVYVGPWLPEPVSTEDDPALGAERAEALDLALLLLMERLTPKERAAYVLREAFDYPFRQIAEILETSEPHARQLAKRARDRITDERRRPVDAAEHRRLLRAFLDAARSGDVAALENLLADDAVSYSDGGGLVRAARAPVCGRSRVARFLAGVVRKFHGGTETTLIEVNGRPAVLVSRDGRPVSLAAIDATTAGIARVLMVVNPHKLTRLSR